VANFNSQVEDYDTTGLGDEISAAELLMMSGDHQIIVGGKC
jgi:hypothetical protein